MENLINVNCFQVNEKIKSFFEKMTYEIQIFNFFILSKIFMTHFKEWQSELELGFGSKSVLVDSSPYLDLEKNPDSDTGILNPDMGIPRLDSKIHNF